jgi:tetratricopeptide (TPR) repeat protein
MRLVLGRRESGVVQVLRAVEVAGLNRWRWVLAAESGQVLADRQVDLDVETAEYEAFCDLAGHIERHRLPHDPVGSEADAVDRVSAWISDHVFGDALLTKFSGTVRVIVPRGAEFLLSRPLELARVKGVVLARRQVSLVYEPAGLIEPTGKEDVTGSVRILALFSMPARSSVLALRRERFELAKTVRTIAAKSRKAIELRVLQYGVTRERLSEAVEEYPGWDVLHVSGHGEVGALLLEKANGEPDLVSTDELVELLAPARNRLKLAVLSACQSGAAEAATTLHTLGLDELAEQVSRDQDGATNQVNQANQVGLARGLVEELGVTALAMRYSVADGFAVALAGELYPRLFGAGQPVDRAVALALPKAVGQRPTAAVPAASIGTPMLVGAGTVGLRVAPPPGVAVLDPYAERMAWFPQEHERFVGRTQALVEASTALAPESGRTGVLFVGMVGAGKSACALELAHQHRGRFGALAWWRAPDQPDEFNQALAGFATALETQLGIPMPEAVGSEATLRRFLPRLAAVLREEAVLLVLDHVDTLLSGDACWRDPMWDLLVESLIGHGGLSRVVLTSRVAPADLDPGLVAVLPTHSLSIAESVLLARELPHLGELLRDKPTAERAAARSGSDFRLARRVLNMAQGHPKLLELADHAAAEPGRLASMLDAAEAVGRDTPVTAFFTTGASALDGGQFMRLLTAWTGTALSGLPVPARTLVELLAHVEEDERRSWIVREVWQLVWAELHGEQAPPLERALEPLVSAVLVEAEPVGGDGSTAQQVYRLHPGVGEAIRAGSDPAFGALVDEMTIRCLTAVYEHAHTKESRGESGSAIVWSGLATTPYLLRSGRWAQATSLLDSVTDRDLDPGTTNRAMGYLRRMFDHDDSALDRPAVAHLYAKLLSRSDPQAATQIFLDLVRTGVESKHFDLASVAAADCARIYLDHGDLDDALELAHGLKELTELAGYGPWTQVADECLELSILDRMGKHNEAASRAVELVDIVDGLPDDSGEPERVTPVSIRGVVLSTALGAVTNFGDWHIALDLCERIDDLHRRRGATEHETARLRLNKASVLLRLGRVDEAEDVLRHSQAVFEDVEDTVLLGEVFRLRAEVRNALGRTDDALTMAQAALRYSYESASPGALAEGHDTVASYLSAAGHPARVYFAHRTAANMLRAAVAHAEGGGPTIIETSDLLAHGPDLMPRTLEELVETVEQTPGVRLDLVLRFLVPDDADRDELFDKVVSPLREKMRIAQKASANYREKRPALIEALNRAEDGDDESLFENLDECDSELVGAIRALLDRGTKKRLRATQPAGEPRLFGAQIVPPMTGHDGSVGLVGFAELDGQPVAVTADEKAVRTWDLRTHRQIGEPITIARDGLNAAALGVLAQRPVAVISHGSGLHLCDLTTREHLGEIVAPYLWRNRLAICAVACTVWNGRSLAVTGSYDSTVRLWDLDRREQIGAPLTGNESVVRAVAFGIADGRLVALSGGEDATVRIWDVERHEPAGVLRGHEDAVWSVALGTLNGRPIALSGSRDNTMRIWDVRDHQELRAPVTDHDAAVDAVAFGVLEGRPVALSGGSDETVRLWDLESGNQIGPPLTEGRIAMGIASLALGELDGHPTVLAGDHDAMVRVWNLEVHHEMGMDVPAWFASELPATWTNPDSGETYDLTDPITDDQGSPWVYLDFDGFHPILAEPDSLDVTLNLIDVDDEYGLSNISRPATIYDDSDPDGSTSAIETLKIRSIACGQAGLHNEALADLDSVLELDPGHVEARSLRANVLRKLGRFEEAVAEFTVVLNGDLTDEDRFFELADRGMAYSELGRRDDALAGLTAALELNPDNFFVWYRRGALLEEMGRLDDALADLDHALGLEPDFIEARILRAGVLRDLGRLEDAVAEYTVILNSNPAGSVRFFALSFRGVLREMLDHREDALVDFTAALELDPDNVEVRYGRGKLQVEMGRLDDALADFDHVLGSEPEHVAARLLRGDVLRDLGRFEEAVAEYTIALGGDPTDEHRFYALANRGTILYEELDHQEDALVDFTAALELDPDSVEVRFGRGKLLAKMGLSDDALADLDHALGFEPEHVETRLLRGDLLRDLGRFEEAVAEYTIALNGDPANAYRFYALVYRGLLHGELDRQEDALVDFTAALELDPDNVGVLYDRGKLLAEMGLSDDALADLGHLLEREPDHVEARLLHGDVLRGLGWFEEAAAEYAIALNGNLTNAQRVFVLVKRGWSYQGLGHHDSALADFTAALESDPELLSLRLARGNVLRDLGQFEEAVAEYTIVLNGSSTNAERVLALTQRARSYIDLARYDDALTDLDEALVLDPTQRHLATRSLVNWYRGDLPSALADIDRAVQVDPDDLNARRIRADLLWVSQRFDEALGVLDTVIKLDETNPKMWAKRGKWLMALDRYGEAAGAARRLTDLAPQRPIGWYIAGVCLSRLGRRKALKFLTKALALDPTSKEVSRELARAYGEAGQHDDALRILDELVASKPSDGNSLGDRAWEYLMQGLYAQAEADIDRAIAVLPDNDWWNGVCSVIKHQLGGSVAAVAAARRALELSTTKFGDRPMLMQDACNRVLYHILAGDDDAATQLCQRLLDSGPAHSRLAITTAQLEIVVAALPDSAAPEILKLLQYRLLSTTNAEDHGLGGLM